MSIIMIKDKGVSMPTKKELYSCYKTNSAYFMLMFSSSKQIIEIKGTYSFADLVSLLDKVYKRYRLKSKVCVYYFKNVNTNTVIYIKPPLNPYNSNKNYMYFNIIFEELTESKELSDKRYLHIVFNELVNLLYSYDSKFFEKEEVMKLIYKLTRVNCIFLFNNNTYITLGKFYEENNKLYSNDMYYIEKELNENMLDMIHSRQVYDELLSECSIEEDVPKFKLEKALEKITILDGDEVVYSKNGRRKYEAAGSITYGYDTEMNLYEIDYRKDMLVLIEKNIKFKID